MPRAKLLLLLTLLVLLLLAGYLALSRPQRETLKPIFSADSLAVMGIEISQADNILKLNKDGGHWNITSPVKWSVEDSRMSLFLKEVIQENYSTTPIASGKQALQDYGFETGRVLKVKALNGKGKLLREVWFSNPGNPFDYFRFAGSSDVYQIRQKVATVYLPDFDAWRSPYVLRLFSDQMLSIKVSHPKNEYELTRKGNLWHFKDRIEDFEVPPGNPTMGKLLNILAALGSYSILSEDATPTPDSLQDVACAVTILQTDRQTRRITFYPYGENYLMSVDTHPGKYFIVLFDTVFRFTRHAMLFRSREGYPPQ